MEKDIKALNNMKKKVAFVIPVWNEENRIIGAYKILKEALIRYGYGDSPIIFTADGCTDRTVEIIKKIISDDPSVKLFYSSRRLGRGASLSRVLLETDVPYIIYMDVDMSTDLSYIPEFIGLLEKGVDIVIGSRLLPDSICKRSLKRDIPSRFYNSLASFLFHTGIKDHQCGFKGFNRKRILGILKEVESSGWFWDTELLIRASKAGLKIAEVPVIWVDRSGKDSKVRIISDSLLMGSSLFVLKWKLLPGWIREAVKFAFVGIINTLITFTVLILLAYTVGHNIYSYPVAYTAGAVNGFFMNKKYTFGDKSGGFRLFGRFLGYIVVFCTGVLLYTFTCGILEFLFGFHYIPAALGGTFVNFVFSFTMSRFFIFRADRRGKKNERTKF